MSLGTDPVNSTTHAQSALRRSASGAPGEKSDTSFDEMLDSALPDRAAHERTVPEKPAPAPERAAPERPVTEAAPADRIEPPAKATSGEHPPDQTAAKDSAATGQPNPDANADPAAGDESADTAATDPALLLAMLNPTPPPPVAAVVPVTIALVPEVTAGAEVPAVPDVLAGSPQPAAPAAAADQTLTPVPAAAASVPQPTATPAGPEIAPASDGESLPPVTNAPAPATASATDQPAPTAAAPVEGPDVARTDDKTAAPAAPQAKTAAAELPTRAETTATTAEPAKQPNQLQAAAAAPVPEPAPEQADAAPEHEANAAGEKPASARGHHADTLLGGAKPAASSDAPLNQAPAAGNAPLDAQPVNVAPTPATPVSNGQPAATPQAQTPNVTTAYAPAVTLSGLAVELIARARDGTNRFEIRLDPPELGRIDVHLRMDRDGNVTSRLYVERSETLDLLRRDAPQLERALNQAGLKTSDQGLEFSLRDQGFGRDPGTRDEARQNRLVVTDDVPVPAPAGGSIYGRRLGLGSGLDIRV